MNEEQECRVKVVFGKGIGVYLKNCPRNRFALINPELEWGSCEVAEDEKNAKTSVQDFHFVFWVGRKNCAMTRHMQGPIALQKGEKGSLNSWC